MSSNFKLSLLANFAGTGWSALMQVVCIPLYIKFMGIESYGLIGFYVMLQAMLQVLDLGVSPTINREMARYCVQAEKREEARDLVRTIEVGYWLIGFTIGITLLAGSGWLSAHWIKASSLPSQKVSQALMLMSVLSVFQWPVSFYQGGLMGLQRQVLYNIIRVVVVTLNNGGAVLILWSISPTITALLTWQVGVNAVQTWVLMTMLWKSLEPKSRAPQISLRLVRGIWRFAAGMSGITFCTLVLTQIDKVFVSKLLTLKMFGYYALAWTVASGLLLVAGAVFAVVFPRMSAQVAAGDESGLRRSYHGGSQLMAVLILPFAAVLSLFSFDVLHLWTRNPETASCAALVMAILVVGSALNALFLLPYSLQLAFGWTKLILVAGLLSIAVFIPMIIQLTRRFGAVGAAAVWVGLNISNMLVAVPIMHRRLLKGEVWGYARDIGFPLVSTVLIATIGKLLFATLWAPGRTLMALSTVWLACLLTAVMSAPQIRSWVLTSRRKQKRSYA